MLKRVSFILLSSLGLCLSYSLTASESFKVLSYNPENVWDDIPENTQEAWDDFIRQDHTQQLNLQVSPLQYKDYSQDFSNWYSPTILDAKIAQILEVVRLAGYPEILALQEIESAGNHSKVFDMKGSKLHFRKEFEKQGYHYFYLGEQSADNPVAVTPAVISKFPLQTKASISIDFPDDPASLSARDIQVLEYKKGKHRMLIFNNHWKSKRGGSESEKQRVFTAELLKQRIAEERQEDPEVRILVLGDLSSLYFEQPIELISTHDEQMMLGAPTEKLYNSWYEPSEEDRWETSFKGVRQSLSAMLISDSFYYEHGLRYVDNSFEVIGHKDPAAKQLLTDQGLPFRWQLRKNSGYTQHLGKGYSDHLPLMMEFQISDQEPSSRKMQITRPKKSFPKKTEPRFETDD